MRTGNIYAALPAAKREEVFETLLSKKGVKIERITSFGQATPEGEWLEEKKNEWVVLLKGRAVLRFKGTKKALSMGPGDHVFIPAGKAHRVDRTMSNGKSIWLAVHF
jgi:cupin 2 domain-containing protein